MIEMNWSRILREQSKPEVIGRNDSSSLRVLVNIAYLEVFEESASPPFFHRHGLSPGASSVITVITLPSIIRAPVADSRSRVSRH
jgi:hypothetical protein